MPLDYRNFTADRSQIFIDQWLLHVLQSLVLILLASSATALKGFFCRLTLGATCVSKHLAAPIWSTGASLALLISRIFANCCIQLVGCQWGPFLTAAPFSSSYSTLTWALLGLRDEAGKVWVKASVSLFCTEVPGLETFPVTVNKGTWSVWNFTQNQKKSPSNCLWWLVEIILSLLQYWGAASRKKAGWRLTCLGSISHQSMGLVWSDAMLFFLLLNSYCIRIWWFHAPWHSAFKHG